MQSHVKSAVEQIIPAPRFICENKLLLAVRHAVVVRSNCRLKLIHCHTAAGVHGYNAVGNVESPVNAGHSRAVSVKFICTLRIDHRRACLGEPHFLAVIFLQLSRVVVRPVGIVAADYINRVQQTGIFFLVKHHSGYFPCSDCLAGHNFYFRKVIRCAAVGFKMLRKIDCPFGIYSALIAVGTYIV